MAAAQQQQKSAQQIITENRALRQMLLASAPKMRKKLGVFPGGTLGGNTRVKLFNVGITTRLLLDVQVNIDVATATATLSNKGPFNLINRLKLTDYDGTDRVNCSGFQLFMLNCIRNKNAYGYNNNGTTAVFTNPDVPALTAGANKPIRFMLEVPLAFDPQSDLRGALLSQTAVGEAYLSLDWITSLVANGNDDALCNGAPTSVVTLTAGTSISVTVYQEYLLPQAVGGQVPLPNLDLMTVYELAGALRTSDNIASGSEKLINYPNVRSVIGAYVNWRNVGVLSSGLADLSGIRLIANGNNVLREYSVRDKLFEQRLQLSGDVRQGTFFELHRDKPVETALFGNVQLGITPQGAITAPFDFEVLFESFYTKGSVLPGMSQTA